MMEAHNNAPLLYCETFILKGIPPDHAQVMLEECPYGQGRWQIRVVSAPGGITRLLGRASLQVEEPEAYPVCATILKWTGVLVEGTVGQQVLALLCRFLTHRLGVRQIKGDILCYEDQECKQVQTFFETYTGWTITRIGQRRIGLAGRVGYWGDMT